MSSNFYTDELAMQAADDRTETIAESAAAGSEQEGCASEVKPTFYCLMALGTMTALRPSKLCQ